MCGILGMIITDPTVFSPHRLSATLRDVFLLSESRGKEASGVALVDGPHIQVLKSAVPASALLRTSPYKTLRDHAFQCFFSPQHDAPRQPFQMIGHSRLVTTGHQDAPQNNQPVIAGGMVVIHNGIIVNHEALWQTYAHLERRADVDTEIFGGLLRMFYDQTGSMGEAARRTFAEIRGTASIACFFEDLDGLLLATNNGSLYYCHNASRSVLIFASERHILRQLLRRSAVNKAGGADWTLQQIPAGTGCLINPTRLECAPFALTSAGEPAAALPRRQAPRTIVELPGIVAERPASPRTLVSVGLTSQAEDATQQKALTRMQRRFPHDPSWSNSLRRCTVCILPETMPFIEFNADGVCNYCRSYQRLEFKGRDQLQALAEQHRRRSGEPDCVVGVSGGRDSLYTLHYVKTILDLHPVAYTYDWGMVTDLARRNISRICAQLGVEHILVSANIPRKREFIRKNVTAWLKKPDLGMIPLFMAGDKQYFYYHYQVRRQVGAALAIQGENRLERTDFKSGFAGAPPYSADHEHHNTLSLRSKLQLGAYYGCQYARNPAYLNASVLDTLFAYACYYIIDRAYLNLYNYIPWLEDEVVTTLIKTYDFELAPDTSSTWRIGDGTAAFYNYIYYAVAGFTENDTFRSNQIREGLISRTDALQRVQIENQPRYASIYWYLNVIGLELEMEQVLERIHAIPKLQPVRR